MEKKNLRGSLTEQNLLKAFAGESQAANRYRLFAERAREEGFEKIARFFHETVHNEKTHARIYFGYLQGGMVEFTAAFPAGIVSNTLDNLAAAAQGEYDEWSDLYPEFGRVAQEEGYLDVARSFLQIADIEKEHEARFRGLYDTLSAGHIFEKLEDTVWRCIDCGHIYTGKKAPKQCPVCGRPQGFYEIKCDKY